jgi:hypothetical protein
MVQNIMLIPVHTSGTVNKKKSLSYARYSSNATQEPTPICWHKNVTNLRMWSGPVLEGGEEEEEEKEGEEEEKGGGEGEGEGEERGGKGEE